jgi:outer membrane protein assembly factor BamB
MKKQFLLLHAIMLLMIVSFSYGQENPDRQWPAYRGYFLSGILDDAGLPSSFDLETMTNVRWKTEVPGLGLSSPVIWGNRLLITTAISKADNAGFKPGIYGDVTPVDDSSEHEWKILCYDKNNGKLLWDVTAHKGIPAMKRHPKSTHANTSLATDGRYVVAFFGSEGLYCYDMNGNLQWQKNFGVLESAFFMMHNAEWEFASSPIIYNGKVIIQCDVLENSFVAAFDVKTGKELWKTTRDDYPAWCTPNVYKTGNKTYVVVNGYKHIGGYDIETGREIWRMSGGGDIPIPSPIIGENTIFLNSAHGKNSPIFAIDKGAKGDISIPGNQSSTQFVKWSKQRGGSYIQTLLLYRNHLYNLSWNGMISCFDPETGKEIFSGKLGKANSFVASPVASDGRIYAVDETGTVYIIQDGNEFKELAEIPLDGICMTAPAITDGMIIFRTQKGLIAVGKK